jgi:thiol-disulfide isomerase/thioredoxin
MRMTTRRAALAAAAALAVASLAVVALWRKPAPVVHTPVAAPADAAVQLQGMAALAPIDPPLPPPDVTFTDAEGAMHGLAEFAGKVVVVNLWATWCQPCIAELPSLAALARRGAAAGIVVLAVSSDSGGAAAVQRYYAAHGIEGLSVWLDPLGDAARALGARGIPTTLIIDRRGRQRARLEGSADWASDAALAAIEKAAG